MGNERKKWFFEDGENGEFLINYGDILTSRGQSGCGVFYRVEDTDEYYVIGVHVLGRAGEDTYNSATWITRERFNQIGKWIDRSKMGLVSRKIAHKSQIGKKEVKSLEFYGKRIGNFGVEILSKHTIPNLESLNLSQNKIGRKRARILNEETNWPNLTTLNLSSNEIGAKGVIAIRKRWPTAELDS